MRTKKILGVAVGAVVVAFNSGCLAVTDADMVQALLRDWVAFAVEVMTLLPGT
jgi:hypothetical protein